MLRRRVLAVVAATVAVALVLAGLGAREWSRPRVIETPGATVLVSGYTGGGSDAALGGRLAVLPSGCLGFEGSDSVAVFPHGTSVVSQEPLRLRIGGQEIGLGEEIGLAGGTHRWDNSAPEVPGAPRECTTGEYQLLWGEVETRP